MIEQEKALNLKFHVIYSEDVSSFIKQIINAKVRVLLYYGNHRYFLLTYSTFSCWTKLLLLCRLLIRWILYVGDTDMACNFLMGQQFADRLGLRVINLQLVWIFIYHSFSLARAKKIAMEVRWTDCWVQNCLWKAIDVFDRSGNHNS